MEGPPPCETFSFWPSALQGFPDLTLQPPALPPSAGLFNLLWNLFPCASALLRSSSSKTELCLGQRSPVLYFLQTCARCSQAPKP